MLELLVVGGKGDRMRSHLLLVLMTLSMTAVTAAAQPPMPQPARPGPPPMSAPVRDNQPEKVGTAVLSGRVVDAETGKPLRRALVRATSSETPQGRSVSTDADGRWQLKSLPAASYRISVSKGGFVEISYGQKRPFEAARCWIWPKDKRLRSSTSACRTPA
jgi:hypothetical protein